MFSNIRERRAEKKKDKNKQQPIAADPQNAVLVVPKNPSDANEGDKFTDLQQQLENDTKIKLSKPSELKYENQLKNLKPDKNNSAITVQNKDDKEPSRRKIKMLEKQKRRSKSSQSIVEPASDGKTVSGSQYEDYSKTEYLRTYSQLPGKNLPESTEMMDAGSSSFNSTKTLIAVGISAILIGGIVYYYKVKA
jgi:hypothetical protein